MLGGCIYQFSRQGTGFFIDEVGWKLPFLWISNAMYIRCRSSYRYKTGEFIGVNVFLSSDALFAQLSFGALSPIW